MPVSENSNLNVKQKPKTVLQDTVRLFDILEIQHYGPPLPSAQSGQKTLTEWLNSFPERHGALKRYIPDENILFGIDGNGAQDKNPLAKIKDVADFWESQGYSVHLVDNRCVVGANLDNSTTYILHYVAGRASLAVFTPAAKPVFSTRTDFSAQRADTTVSPPTKRKRTRTRKNSS